MNVPGWVNVNGERQATIKQQAVRPWWETDASSQVVPERGDGDLKGIALLDIMFTMAEMNPGKAVRKTPMARRSCQAILRVERISLPRIDARTRWFMLRMMSRSVNIKLARMSSGKRCFIRDLGLVRGGKGLRHHEVILELSWRGVFRFMVSRLRVSRGQREPRSRSHPGQRLPHRGSTAED
jgi:hypothetical protein